MPYPSDARLTKNILRTLITLSVKIPSILGVSNTMLRSGMNMGAYVLPRSPISPQRTKLAQCPTAKFVGHAPSDTDPPIILYLHGGGFVLGSWLSHRGLCGQIAHIVGAVVYTPNYRLAPENPYPAAIDDCEACFKAVQTLHPGKPIFVAGDSAGGGLALSLAIRLRDAAQTIPVGLILLSPFTDLTISSPTSRTNAWKDSMLYPSALRKLTRQYYPGRQGNEPEISPLFAQLDGLPPLLIQAGEHEILRDDASQLAVKTQALGIPTVLQIYPKMWHVFQLHFGQLASANHAIQTIRTFVVENSKFR